MERRYHIENETEIIQEIQQYLLSVTPNEANNGLTRHGAYDQTTEDAVRAFQVKEGLEETGVVDYITWNLLYERHIAVQDSHPFYLNEEVFDIQLGDTGSHIIVLQTLLGELSEVYPTVLRPAITGQFGLTTADAVRAVQRSYGQYTSGIVSPQLWNFMLRDWTSKKQIEQYSHIF